VLPAVLALVFAACGTGHAAPADHRRLQVVTTVSPITSIVATVAGGLVDVRGLVPEGADSHTYEPKPSSAKTLANADVVFVNGLRLEDPTRDLAAKNLRAGAEIVELASRTITPDQQIFDFSFPRSGGKPNPHLWTDPPYAKRYAEIAADVLSRRDPADAAAFRANEARFAAKVDELDAAMTSATATLPPERRVLLTYHDAYAYFADHYGWRVIGAIQVSSFEDPTPQEVARLITQIKQEKVPAIFGSEVFPSPVLAEIGKETGVRYVDKLRDDDLPGRPGDADHSWLGLMKSDFVTMVTAMGGDASALARVDVTDGRDSAVYPQ
jgi:ABC-type Zn uptake system ZnuABC Zn-binding protein ZnuA